MQLGERKCKCNSLDFIGLAKNLIFLFLFVFKSLHNQAPQ